MCLTLILIIYFYSFNLESFSLVAPGNFLLSLIIFPLLVCFLGIAFTWMLDLLDWSSIFLTFPFVHFFIFLFTFWEFSRNLFSNHFTDFFFFFWLCHAACGIWVPRPGIERGSLAVQARSLNHLDCQGIPLLIFFFKLSYLWFPKALSVFSFYSNLFCECSIFFYSSEGFNYKFFEMFFCSMHVSLF